LQGEAENLLNPLFATHPGKTRYVSAGFLEKQEISQWQMLADL